MKRKLRTAKQIISAMKEMATASEKGILDSKKGMKDPLFKANKQLLDLVIMKKKPVADILPYPELVLFAERKGLVLRGSIAGKGLVKVISCVVSYPIKVRETNLIKRIENVGVSVDETKRIYARVKDKILADALEYVSNKISLAHRKIIITRKNIKSIGRLQDQLDVKLLPYHILAGILFGYRPCCIRAFAQQVIIRGKLAKYGPIGQILLKLIHSIQKKDSLAGNLGFARCNKCKKLSIHEYFKTDYMHTKRTKHNIHQN